MIINLNKLIDTLRYYYSKHGDMLVYIGTDHGSTITAMTTDDYDLVNEREDGCVNPLPKHLIIGRDVSRE